MKLTPKFLIAYRVSSALQEGKWAPDDKFYDSEEEARSNMESLALIEGCEYDIGIVSVMLPEPDVEMIEDGLSEEDEKDEQRSSIS